MNRYNEVKNEKREVEKTLSLLTTIKKEMNICDPKKVIDKYIRIYLEDLNELKEYMDILLEEEIKNEDRQYRAR